MADILVTCPSCRGQITCDNAWAGQEVDCPLCNKPVVVPAKAGPGGLPTPAGKQPPAGPGRNIPIRNLTQPVAKKKNPLQAMLPVLGIVLVLGVSGYFGWPYFQQWREKRAGGAAASGAEGAAAAGATNAAPARTLATSLPVMPATWTLDIGAARITEGRASGELSGTNFVVDSVQSMATAGAQILRLIEGPVMAPEREVMIYLRLQPGQTMASQNLTVSKETRGGAVQMLVKRWKSDPRYAPKLQSYSSGYVLKLETGAEVDGNIPGKIYLALPDKEQSVVSGKFDLPAVSAVPGMPGVAVGGMDPARTEMMRRYRTNRPPSR